MSVTFNPQRGLIVIRAKLYGPSGDMMLRLALDTGATVTMISLGPLIALGYDPALIEERVQVTTGSGIERVPRIEIRVLEAIGRERARLPVLGHTLPPTAGIDGLLGLDFLRGLHLEINFREGHLALH